MADKDKKGTDGVIKAGNGDRSREVAAFWKDQQTAHEQFYKGFYEKSAGIIRRYRDERASNITKADAMRRMNTLWMNTNILKPALYSRCPIPIVERRFLDKDPKARLSAQMLERATRTEIEFNGLHASLGKAVWDYLLVGRGVVWVRYEPEIEEGDSLPATYQQPIEDDLADAEDKASNEEDKKPVDKNDKTKADKLETTNEQLLSERAPVDYIDYRDFRIYPAKARTWDEVQAIGKRVAMSRQQCIKRFGEKIGKAIKPDSSYENDQGSGPISEEQVTYQSYNNRNIIVEEIWNKVDRKIYWISTGYEGLCDVKDDFLDLKNFFPVPRPLFSNVTNDTVIPVADFTEYEDQALQIDELTQRLSYLTKACKVVGAYAAESDALKRMLDEGFENQLIPVEDWQGMSERGGIEGLITYLPIDIIQSVIETLTKVRQNLVTDMDMLTGLSDVVRGTTDSRETLGGIRLKNNNAGTRLSDRQQIVAEYAKETINIVSEIIAKHYSDEAIIEQSGIKLLDELQVETVIAELKRGKSKKEQMSVPQQKPLPAAPGAGLGATGNPPNMGSPPSPPPFMPGGPPQQPLVPPNQSMQPPGSGLGGGLMPPAGPPQQPQPGGLSPEMMERLEELMLKEEAEEIIKEKIEGALELLRENLDFYYRIDIETNSTIFADQMQDKQDANEFITAISAFMKDAAIMVQQSPQFAPLAGRILQWGVRKYRVGRDLESAIDNFIQEMEGTVKDLKDNPKPNPEEQKAQMDMAIKQQEIAHQKQMQQMEQMSQQQNDERDIMKAQMEDQRQKELNQMEMMQAQQKAQLEREKMELEKELMLMKHQLEVQKLNMDAQHKERTMQMDMQHQQQSMQMKQTEAQQTHQMNMQSAQQQAELQNSKHQQSIEAQNQKHKLGMQANEQKHSQMKEQAAIKQKAAKQKAPANG